MKKFLLIVAVMAMGATLLTGCSEDDSHDDSRDTSPGHFVITKGVFVVNNGSSDQSFEGSLTYFDYVPYEYTNAPVERDVYKMANGKDLGAPNDVIVYGQKVYIVCSDDHAIVILDVRTCKELKWVSTTNLLGDWEGRIPRRIAAYDGNVYFTTSSGYVAAIDTINFALQQKYQVGPSPEGLAFDVNRSTLYVANSDVGYGNGSISKIDITSGIATEIRNDKVKYPQEIAVAGDVLYVLDGGYYTDDWSEQVDAGVYMVNNYDAQLMVPNATGMAAIGDMIYTYNDPLGGSGATYSIFDIRSNNLSTLNLSGDSAHRLVSPCAINVDQVTGYIYIASRLLDPDTGYPSKTMPGFVNIYSNSGQFMESFETGIEPHKIEFNHYLSWNGVN